MKSIIQGLISALLLGSCSSSSSTQENRIEHSISDSWMIFGDTIKNDSAPFLEQVTKTLDTAKNEVMITAEIKDICQAKGCWMTLKTPNGQSARVTFKDYSFFVPKDASGKKVIIKGIASLEELAIEEAKHYADDAGEDFDPEASRVEISILASGVLISKGDQL